LQKNRGGLAQNHFVDEAKHAANMPEKPKIFLIDDNPDDCALVTRELRRVFPDFDVLQSANKEEFEQILKTGGFDLVITDYQLWWADGLSVLRQVKRLWPDCPVVMFTGTGSEAVAVEGMKSGLSDYVLKSPAEYTRLAGAAQRALQTARQQRELRSAEMRFSRLFDTVPVGLYRATPAGEILDANPALLGLLGRQSKESLLNTKLSDLHLHPADYNRWRAILEIENEALRYETEWRQFDGGVCWVENNARLIPGQLPGEPKLILEGSVEDITQRKEAENEREHLILELQEALKHIHVLGGMLPICAACKKIRDEEGKWTHIESYIQTHSDAEFTHSFCPECVQALYPDFAPGSCKADAG
jgi:PAS domain S-box-containing protein